MKKPTDPNRRHLQEKLLEHLEAAQDMAGSG
jgi:hypothetical protein